VRIGRAPIDVAARERMQALRAVVGWRLGVAGFDIGLDPRGPVAVIASALP